MIIVYSLCACFCAYLAALGGYQSFKNFRKIFTKEWLRSGEMVEMTFTKVVPKSRDAIALVPTKVEEKLQETNDTAYDDAQMEAIVRPTPPQPRKRRVIVAMTGATGAILGIRLLQKLGQLDVETHLVISKWADATISYETDFKLREVRALASKVYSLQDVAAPISSGSFKVDAMIVVPCSMKTLSSIATGYGDDLISRAADVTLKERRRLILVARETPLSGIHLQNMLTVTQNGAIIFPPVPAFYIRPRNVDDIVDQSVGRMLDLIDIDTADFERWNGMHLKAKPK